MSDQLSVRIATSADTVPITALSTVLGYPVERDIMQERLDRLLSSSADVVFVAVSAPGVVGWIHGALQELLESGPRCEILGLVVAPDFRQHGVGCRLVAAVEDWALSHGRTQLAVRSSITRDESHPFYARLGYERIKTQHAYRKMMGPQTPA